MSTQLTPIVVNGNVLEALSAAAAGGNYFTANAGVPYHRYYLRLKNTNGSPRVLTIATQRADDQGNTTNKTVTVPATTGDMIVPLAAYQFDDARKCHLSFDAVADLTIGVFQQHATNAV
jgi:hypothetical protein